MKEKKLKIDKPITNVNVSHYKKNLPFTLNLHNFKCF